MEQRTDITPATAEAYRRPVVDAEAQTRALGLVQQLDRIESPRRRRQAVSTAPGVKPLSLPTA